MQYIDLHSQFQLIEKDVKRRINLVLDSGLYIMGPEVTELEKQIAKLVGVKQAIAVSSGTDALILALKALGVQAGDEVITSPFSFFASGETIALLGAKPVFVDIDPRTYNMDPNLLEAAITDKTKVIMPVSLFGQCADMDAINAIASKYALPVIEDAAQSFGATYKNRYSCSLTTVACTSYFPSKPLGAYGDAGACFTNDELIAEKIRQLLNHGQDSRYHHIALGINGRMDSIQAAVLLSKLTIFPEEIKRRRAVAAIYTEALADYVKTPFIADAHQSIFAQYTIEASKRDRLQLFLEKRNIPTAVHYPVAMHQQPAFSYLGYQEGDFPMAESASRRVISLPIHPYLQREDQQIIIDAIIHGIE